MASQYRTSPSEELAIPMVVAIVLHAVLGCGLLIASGLVDRNDDEDESDEMDFEPPPPKVVRVEPPLPRLPDPPQPVVLPDPPPVQPRTTPQVRSTTPRVTSPQAPQTPVTSNEPVVGEEGPPEGEPVVLPDVFVSGDVEVGQGTKRGSGGGGGGGTGNKPPGEGGTAPPAPVSIAAIKKAARPLGDVDYLSTRDYPEEARKLDIGGTVKIRLLVDDQGRVSKRTLLKKLGHGLDELAMQLAGKLRFEPAVDADDRKVSSVVVWTFDFIPPE
jgi:TonB family protein